MMVLPILLLLAVGCQTGNVELDNGGDAILQVTVDELTYRMGPADYRQIRLEAGVHSIIIQDVDGKTLEEGTFEVIEGGLINVAKSTYYIWVDLYGDAAQRKAQLNEQWLDIGNESFYGEFEVIEPDRLYVEKKWDYGLSDDFPDDVYGWKMTDQKWVIKRKLFREAELLNAYKEMVK